MYIKCTHENKEGLLIVHDWHQNSKSQGRLLFQFFRAIHMQPFQPRKPASYCWTSPLILFLYKRHYHCRNNQTF
ncbi:hypothetical protein JTE90_004360 [Oedothorax gibbosus]|uniref:Uncharacterized protein n=1 Tax=Oedothorax gibbosus TaxID=931172 RepID=A0AAV6VKA4_9ARAC|nr:hypothetical protein JTE90_004360 [Oedothorax gibbosus]